MRIIELAGTISIGLLFLVLFASGAWMAYSGRPYDNLVVTVHRLLSVLTVIATAATIYLLATGK